MEHLGDIWYFGMDRCRIFDSLGAYRLEGDGSGIGLGFKDWGVEKIYIFMKANTIHNLLWESSPT